MASKVFKKARATLEYRGGQKIEHDVLMMQTKDDQWLLLHYMNCVVRYFADDYYNHIEIWNVNGDRESCIGIRMPDKEIVDYLITSGYPHRYDAIVDEHTEAWAIEMEQSLGITAIEDFLQKQINN